MEEASATTLSRSPLYERHIALGAKLSPFGGWEMPLSYAGTVEEHTAVRSDVGVFDVSHLGKGRVSGRRAREFVNATLTNDLGRIEPGEAQYTLCCDDSGGVVDDLIVYLHSDDDVFLVPNAANTAEVVRRLQAAAPSGIEVTDLHRSLAVLAVQGPRSPEVLAALGLPAEHEYMSFVPAEWHGHPVVVCRSGYTGERGYELLPHWEDAGELWDALLATGATPCGLGARDTLRTEMGYPLHGQDLSLEISPVQARLRWAVGWDKPHFWGREALLAEREAGPRRMLWGLKARDRGIPRHGMRVLSGHGVPVGVVTSGTFSPTLRTGIALALLDRGVTEGDVVSVDIRGRSTKMQVVKPPFVQPSTR
jgi:aminomethyltransferase